MLTVMQVLPELNYGGVERGAVDIANYLVNHGHRAIIVSSGGVTASRLNKNVIVVNYKYLKSKNPFWIIKNIFFLRKQIEKYLPNIVHARSRAPAWSAYFAAKKCKVTFVTTFHGFYSYHNALKRKYNSVMLKGVAIIAVSKAIEEHLINVYGVAPEKIVTINRSLDEKIFSRTNLSAERTIQMEQSLQLPTDKLRILLPSRLSSKKGHLYLLQALSLLKRDDYICVMLDSNKRTGIRRKVLSFVKKTPVLHNKVRLLDYQSDFATLYHICDLIVCPAIFPEAFGRTIIEACAMEKLVIATDIGGPQYTIINNKTGFLVSSDNPAQLAEVINKALDMGPEEAKKITLAAREFVIKNFSLETMCQETLNLYKKLVP